MKYSLSSKSTQNWLVLLTATLFSMASTAARATTWDWDPTGSGSGGSDSTVLTSTWSQGGGQTDWYEVGAGSNPNQYNGSTTDTVVFGAGATSSVVSNYVVNVAGPVNAGVIDFNNYSGTGGTLGLSKYAYTIKGVANNTVITGPSGTMYIAAPGTYVGGSGEEAVIEKIQFSGSNLYEFTGSSTANLSNGLEIQGSTAANTNTFNTFNGNVQVGTGSDFGTLVIDQETSLTQGTGTATNSYTFTVEKGWTLSQPANAKYVAQNTILNGLGNSNNGTISMGGGSDSVVDWEGNIVLSTDASILTSAGSGGTNAYYKQTDQVTGNISGTANLYLGYQGTGNTNSIANSNGVTLQQLIIGGVGIAPNDPHSLASTASTNSGATVIFNSVNGDTNANANGVAGEAVILGQNNALSNASYVILGETSTYAESANVVAPQSENTGNTWSVSDGALDLHGYNQSLLGLLVGGVGGKSNGADVLLQSNNVIFNNSGAGTSVLTITGTAGNAVATGFGGVIEDDASFAAGGGVNGHPGGKVAVEVNGGTLKLSGLNTYTGGTTVDNSGLLEVGQSSSSTTTENTSITGTFGAVTGSLAVNTNGAVDLEGFSETVGSTTLGTNNGGTNQGGTIESSSTTSGGTLYSTGGVSVQGTGNVIGSSTAGTSTSIVGGVNVMNAAALTVTKYGTVDALTVSTGGLAEVDGTATIANVSGNLNGAGTIPTLNILSGGVVSPGSSVGQVLAASNISFSKGGELSYTVAAANTPVLDVSGGFDKVLGGTGSYTINLMANTPLTGNLTIVLVDIAQLTGSTNFSLTDFTLTDPGVTANGVNGSLAWDILADGDNALVFETTFVPEPGTWALLVGGLVVLVMYQRRRQASR